MPFLLPRFNICQHTLKELWNVVSAWLDADWLSSTFCHNAHPNLKCACPCSPLSLTHHLPTTTFLDPVLIITASDSLIQSIALPSLSVHSSPFTSTPVHAPPNSLLCRCVSLQFLSKFDMFRPSVSFPSICFDAASFLFVCFKRTSLFAEVSMQSVHAFHPRFIGRVGRTKSYRLHVMCKRNAKRGRTFVAQRY